MTNTDLIKRHLHCHFFSMRHEERHEFFLVSIFLCQLFVNAVVVRILRDVQKSCIQQENSTMNQTGNFSEVQSNSVLSLNGPTYLPAPMNSFM